MGHLIASLAKEIVLRTDERRDLTEPLESLVEVPAHAEQKLLGNAAGQGPADSSAVWEMG